MYSSHLSPCERDLSVLPNSRRTLTVHHRKGRRCFSRNLTSRMSCMASVQPRMTCCTAHRNIEVSRSRDCEQRNQGNLRWSKLTRGTPAVARIKHSSVDESALAKPFHHHANLSCWYMPNFSFEHRISPDSDKGIHH